MSSGVISVPLELICDGQGQPFQYLNRGDFTLHRPLQSLISGVGVEAYRLNLAYCGRVSNAVIFGKSYVMAESKHVAFVHQSHRDYVPQEFAHYYKAQIINDTRPRPYVSEECCFLGGYSGDAKYFGHFIFEFLYRLAAFEMSGLLERFPVAVFDDVPDSWLSFIELYGVPKSRLKKISRLPAPFFRNVWTASCPNALSSAGYAFWDEGIFRMRERLLANAISAGDAGPKRIFIGRRDATHRKLLNEAEVWAFLEANGFEYVEFAGKPAAEQIRLMRSAEIAVVVSGSNGSLTPFAPRDCIIIDFLPIHIQGGLGAKGFAAVLGQIYERIPARIVDDGSKVGLSNDFDVDIEAVRRAVSLAIEFKGGSAVVEK